MGSFLAWISLIQGAFYIIAGVWPVVHIRSFLKVTGPKTDLWLVQTVGILIAVIGCALLFAAIRRAVPSEIVLLGVASAIALTAVDITFVARRIIPTIYLLDAVAEVILLAGWILGYWLR